MRLINNFIGYRLAVSPGDYQKAQSLKVYTGLIAKVTIALNLAFKQQLIDDQGQVIKVAISKMSLGHYIWRHNQCRDLGPQKYKEAMDIRYQNAHHASAAIRKNNRVLARETSRLISQRSIFKNQPITLDNFVKLVQNQAPLKGHFYKIKKEGKTVGYLLGTVHCGKELMQNLNPEINKAIGKSKIIAGETALDKDIRVNPRPELTNKYKKYIEKIIAVFKQAQLEVDFGMESCLHRKCKESKEPKIFVGLETVEEKHEIFNLLLEEIDLSRKMKDAALKVYNNCLSGQPIVKQYKKFKKDYPRFEQNCRKRNRTMTERAISLLQKEERALIAVGVFHVEGEENMKSLLEAQGYTLKRI